MDEFVLPTRMTADNGEPPIRRDIVRVPPDLCTRALRFQAAVLSDAAGRRGAMQARMRSLVPGSRMAGPAVTVEVRPGDNLMIYAAMAVVQPGDILVIDGKADATCALVGAIMMTRCRMLGLAGVVVDAAVRDLTEIREIGVPVFALGATPNGPTRRLGGRVNWPVSVAGCAVQPGDLIVGDDDGVVVVERERVAEVLDQAATHAAAEAARIARIQSRAEVLPPWLEQSLREAGVLGEKEQL